MSRPQHGQREKPPPARRTPAGAGVVRSAGEAIGTMVPEPTTTMRCAVTGLDLEVTLVGMVDEFVERLLVVAVDEAAAGTEDIFAHRFDSAIRRYERVIALVKLAAPDVRRWSEARARHLADAIDQMAKEVA